MLKHALLGLLHHAEMSGYDMEQFIDTTITHFWNAKLSQIYRTLKQLEKEGLVTSEMQEQDGARAKRVYTLTDSGRQAFKAWVNEFDTDEQEIKLPFLMRLFFYGRKNPDDIDAQLRVWRDVHQKQLDYYVNVLPNVADKQTENFVVTPQDTFFHMMTIRFGAMYEQMVIDWINSVLEDWEAFRNTP